jgi:hypothetical protein
MLPLAKAASCRPRLDTMPEPGETREGESIAHWVARQNRDQRDFEIGYQCWETSAEIAQLRFRTGVGGSGNFRRVGVKLVAGDVLKHIGQGWPPNRDTFDFSGKRFDQLRDETMSPFAFHENAAIGDFGFDSKLRPYLSHQRHRIAGTNGDDIAADG